MYLGIDLGTSSVKSLLIDEEQNIIGSATASLTVQRPHSGWAEQIPADWKEAVRQSLLKLKADHDVQFKKLVSIGLSGQMHGATLLDKNDDVLHPCILWNDTRSHKEAAILDSDPDFRNITGNIVFPGFTAPKLVWIKNNKPELFAQIKTVLLPKDYLRLWLTGEKASDLSDASGTAWLDMKNRCWSDELLAKTDMSSQQMPRLVEGSDASGKLRPELARELGLEPNVIVAGGAGDNAATACGLGIASKGSAFVSLGTSGVLFAANDEYLPNPQSAVHAFCHALPNKWHQMGVILSATDALNWLSRIVEKSPEALVSGLTAGLNIEELQPMSIRFLPYLSGERTPHNDAKIRGSFVGLDQGHSQQDMVQAVLEGVAFALADNCQALADAGTSINRLIAVGGGAQSALWLQILANILGRPIDLPEKGDFGAAFGAARLAILAAENAFDGQVLTTPKTIKSFEPQAQSTQQYSEAYQHYRALYPAISGAMH